MKFLLILPLFALLASAPALADAGLPAGYCWKRCNGTPPPKSPFDFLGKSKSAGDPNTGKPLGATMSVPLAEGGTKEVPTGDFFSQIQGFEEWSAKNCGENLNDEGTVLVAGPCYDDRLKNTWTVSVLNAHSDKGVRAPSLDVINKFFEAATSPAAKKALEETPWHRRGGQKTAFKKCWPKDIGAGTKDTFGVYINGKLCANFQAPPLPGGASVVKGVPAGSRTEVNAEGKAGVYVLGGDLTLVRAEAQFYSPHGAAVKRSAGAYVLGAKVWGEASEGTDISWSLPVELGSIKKGVSATFTIGPIPITVEAGANAKAGVNFMARLTDMWANGRATPYVDAAAYAAGYVNAFIAQAGVEAALTLLKDALDLYGFVGVAVGNAEGKTQFVFTTQIAGENQISALNGHMDLFARVRVPRWLGWKWKTYRTELFNWGGVNAKGMIFSYMLANVPIATFINNEE